MPQIPVILGPEAGIDILVLKILVNLSVLGPLLHRGMIRIGLLRIASSHFFGPRWTGNASAKELKRPGFSGGGFI